MCNCTCACVVRHVLQVRHLLVSRPAVAEADRELSEALQVGPRGRLTKVARCAAAWEWLTLRKGGGARGTCAVARKWWLLRAADIPQVSVHEAAGSV